MKRFVDLLVGFGPLGLFVVSVVDGVGVPIPAGVDALLILLAAKAPEQAYWLAVVTIVGSLIGGMGLFFAARKGGEVYLAKYTTEGRGKTIRGWFLEYGLVTVFIPALLVIPLPLKVAEICAGALGVRPMPFFLTLLAARIPRYFALAYLGAQMGADGAWPWVKGHMLHMTGIAVVLFFALYIMIQITHKRRQRARHA